MYSNGKQYFTLYTILLFDIDSGRESIANIIEYVLSKYSISVVIKVLLHWSEYSHIANYAEYCILHTIE